MQDFTYRASSLSAADGATVVVTEGRGHVRNKPLLAHGPALTRAPLTVLINQQSASASEIFAGAVRDNCRAILVGKRYVLEQYLSPVRSFSLMSCYMDMIS